MHMYMYAVVVNGAGDGHKKIGTVSIQSEPWSRKGSLAKKRLLTIIHVPSDDEKRTAERSEQIFFSAIGPLNTTDQNRFDFLISD